MAKIQSTRRERAMKVIQVLLPNHVQIHRPPSAIGGIDLIDLETQGGYDRKLFINLDLDQIEDEL